jgi:uncharacterized membrane protein YkgB
MSRTDAAHAPDAMTRAAAASTRYGVAVVLLAIAVATFVVTLSFLATAPGAWDAARGFPWLGGAGQFLVKDLVLLGASRWSLAEARGAATFTRARFATGQPHARMP